MRSSGLRNLLIKRWARKQLVRLHEKYSAKIREVEAKQKTQTNALWEAHKSAQLGDLVVCIDFRVHFLKPLLPNDIVESINTQVRGVRLNRRLFPREEHSARGRD